MPVNKIDRMSYNCKMIAIANEGYLALYHGQLHDIRQKPEAAVIILVIAALAFIAGAAFRKR